MMAADGWEEIAAQIEDWINGVLSCIGRSSTNNVRIVTA